jgi:hypothetical protein
MTQKEVSTLKIALMGAPNSGKTELAQQLQQALDGKKVAIVDDYIQIIEQRSNMVLSHYATYLGNMQAAIGRFEAERVVAADKPDVAITCGTLVENAVYTATLAYITNNASEGDTNYRLVNDARANLTMSWLGVLKHDLWDYDLAFYLPLADDADRWDAVVDESIEEAARTMSVDYTTLPQDRDTRVGIVLQEIVQLEATASDEQPTGASAEEGTGDRSGSVSDVSE